MAETRSLSLPSIGTIVVLALVLRLIWILTVPVDPVSDSGAYDIMARNIVEHGVYGFTPEQPSAYWAVGPSALYAGAYMLFGAGGVAVIAVNLVSGLAAVWLVDRVGRGWFDVATGRIAALILACWPTLIQFTTVLASEVHFIALTLAGIAAWQAAGPDLRRGWGWVLLAGLCFGAATYMRPIALLFPATLLLAVLLRTPRRVLVPLAQAAAITAVIIAVVTPWSMRNERVIGEWTFVSTNFWPNFWMGNHPETTGGYTPLPTLVDNMSEPERAAKMRELALADLEADPAGFVWRTVWKAVWLHRSETIGVHWNMTALEGRAGPAVILGLKAVSAGYWFAVLAVALAGAVVLVRRRGLWHAITSPPVALWAYLTAIHAIIVIGDRYHMPSIPMIAVLAALALAALLRQRGWHLPDVGAGGGAPGAASPV